MKFSILYLVACILIILSSCKKQDDSLAYKIHGNDFKYWLLVINEPKFEKNDYIFDMNPMLFFYFDKNYRYYEACRYHVVKGFEIYDYRDSDMVQDNEFTLSKDSIISLDGDEYKIKEITDETMLLYDSDYKRYSLLIAAPKELIPEKYYKLNPVE